MSASSRVRTSPGRTSHGSTCRASSARSGSEKPWCSRARSVLRQPAGSRRATGRRRRARPGPRRRTACATAPSRGRRNAERDVRRGQISQVMPSSASARPAAGPRSSARRARSARAQPVQARPHALGPEQLPACGVEIRPARSAIANASRRRCLARDARRWTARTRPRPGRRTVPPAGPASARPTGAGSGWPRSRPGCRRRSLRRLAGRVEHQLGEGVIPPNARRTRLGSTWISSQRDPSAASSSAASRTSRRTSSSVAAPIGRRRTAAGTGTSPLVRRRQLRRPLGGQRLGQPQCPARRRAR